MIPISLFQQLYFQNGQVAAALMKALLPPYEPIVCDYVIDELHRKFNEKFPNKVGALENFLSKALMIIEVVETPKEAMAVAQIMTICGILFGLIPDRPLRRCCRMAVHITCPISLFLSSFLPISPAILKPGKRKWVKQSS